MAAAKIEHVTTTTLTHVDLPIHQPAPYEKWLAAQPCQGRHRGAPATEDRPSIYAPTHASRPAQGTVRRAVPLQQDPDIKEPTMDSEQPVITSPVTDTRTTPLGKLAAPATLDRLRPSKDDSRPAVAAFNSSL